MNSRYSLHRRGFTLVEIIVSVTIFSLIMVSVMSIFIYTNDIVIKSDINRSMQENLKNVVERISEDVTNNSIVSVSSELGVYVPVSSMTFSYSSGTAVEIGTNNYYLASEVGGSWARVSDISSCDDIQEHCVIYLKDSGPLTNSSVSVEDLRFYVSRDYVPKLTMVISIRPAFKSRIKPEALKNNKIVFQTTISERPLR